MPRSVLIIEQGFLKPRGGKPVHGVELFRLNLIRQLAERGIEVTVIAEASWAQRIAEWLAANTTGAGGVGGAGMVRVVSAPRAGGVGGAGLMGTRRAWRERRRPWDTVLYGNARLGLVPAMYYSQWFGLGERYLLFAHRDPGSNFLDAVSTLTFDVVANSEWVAAWYRGQTPGHVNVCYGLANAERFFSAPPENSGVTVAAATVPPARSKNAITHFCLLGRLPNISKGQEKALAAFRALPDSIKQYCRLHLASFAQPPEFHDPGVVAHAWMPPEKIGDFLRGMDVMLTISTHETFSQAIVQGMLTGLPIIASDLPVYIEKMDAIGATGAGPEIRRGGFLTRNVQEVTEAMARLTQDEPLRRRLGAEGRAIALERYIWDTDLFIREHLFR